jgi:hypothetical protein
MRSQQQEGGKQASPRVTKATPRLPGLYLHITSTIFQSSAREMLDQVLIFTRCGVVLWSKTFCKLKDNPIEEFISTIIIPEKGGENLVSIGSYALKWVLSNTHGIDLIFVVH